MANSTWTLRKRLSNVLLLTATVNYPRFLLRKQSKSLSSAEFSTYDILKIRRSLNPNKAHDDDMISARMLKIYDDLFADH